MLELIHPVRVQVHDRHDLPVGGILRLIEQAAEPGALGQVLERLCVEVRSILSSPVVSIYVREPSSSGDVLVMRANVGLPGAAVNRVRLTLGEGITGFAAECLRPVSAEVGAEHDRFKPVPGIGEEAFPSFLAVPLVQGGQAVGVMVLQRRADEPFGEAEVVLATALAAPFAHALVSARSRDASARRKSRDVSLAGQPVSAGVAFGRARLLPTIDALLSWDGNGEPGRRPTEVSIPQAFDTVCRDLARSARRAADRLPPSAAMALGGLVPLLSDQRLREHAVRACAEHGIIRGLDSIVRAYARAPHRLSGDPAGSVWLAERAQDVEALCILVAARVAGVPLCRAGDVLWVNGRLGGVLGLCAASRRVAGVVVDGPVDGHGLGAALLRNGGVPAVGAVQGLAEWARPGSDLLVDGDGGTVRVHPASHRMARLRRARSV
ncbi:MAG: GAF domain-containing protein [Myxococcota bacterium]